jgi:hypothetical protein
MGILILDGPMIKNKTSGKYLGTHRVSPNYIEHPDASGTNKLWNWYIHSQSEDGTYSISDINKAKELISEYRRWGMEFQIIETASTSDELRLGYFIGYDLSYKSGYSLLSWGLTYHNRRLKDSKKDILRPITLLVEKYFIPRLNEYGLFIDLETITFLHNVIQAIQKFQPNAFEADSIIGEFKPIALGIIKDNERVNST